MEKIMRFEREAGPKHVIRSTGEAATSSTADQLAAKSGVTGDKGIKAVLLIGLSAVIPLTAHAQGKVDILNVPTDGNIVLLINNNPVDVYSGPGMPSTLNLRRSIVVSTLSTNKKEKINPLLPIALSLSDTGRRSRVGPVLIKSYVHYTSVKFENIETLDYVEWNDVDIHDFGNALAGPYALPVSVVRYELSTDIDTKRMVSVPLKSKDTWGRAVTEKIVDKRRIGFSFAPHLDESLASAAAGAAIAREYGGVFDGPIQRVLVAHEVVRPARLMRLTRPLIIGAISINKLLVRTTDYGSTTEITNINPDPAEVTDDIVVEARRKRSKSSYFVYIGNDDLKDCGSITYDKNARLIHLACR